MRFWPEIHWSEGQFLRPHHLQATARHGETMVSAVLAALHPYAWGFVELDLAEEGFENHVAEIRSCELVLRDGTYLKTPENCSVDPREFKAQLDKSSGPMPIYFGVPEMQAVRPNVLNPGDTLDGRSPRFAVDVVERYDENIGDNPQSVEVRRLRGALFFGDEDRGGYDCVSLGAVERTAAGPKLVRNHVPPLLRMRGWAPLCAATESLWNEIRARCEQLGGDAAQRALTFATGAPADIEQLVKLGALNELVVRFGAMVGSPELHPYNLYTLLCEAIGKVTLWDDLRRPRELPPYVHEECGPVFEELFRYLRALVNGMLPKDYVERPFQQKDGGFAVELDYEWFTPNHEMFLGIRSGQALEQILALFRSINFKLASPRQAEEVYKARLMGLEFKPAGTVPNLPKSSDQHYFRISRTPRYWENCETERGIFIRMSPADMPKLTGIKLSLFVVKIR